MLEKKLESFLVEKFKQGASLPEADQKNLFEEKARSGKRVVEIIPRLNPEAQIELLKLLSEFHQIPFVDMDKCAEVDRGLLKLIPEKLMRYFKALPVGRIKNAVTIAMTDPTDVVLVDRLSQYAKCEIIPAFAVPYAIERAIERFLGPLDTLGQAIRKIENEPGAASLAPGEKTTAEPASPPTMQTVNLVNLIVDKAIESRASDIHLEPAEKNFYVRYRIDGVLYDYSPQPPKSMEASIISRIKIMANLDIAEKRLPQDGRIQYRAKDKEVSLRVSSFPTIYGENVVLRVLDHSTSLITLNDLGLEDDLLEKFQQIITRPYGIILVTGPTGSGKTTTLYAALNKINTAERHIVTLEDPVEYRMERIRQSQIDTKSGLTFARGLRSLMRQDPDVIMVGEIRDLETAAIAIQAALTGHLVFSTLHTNDAPSAVTRLLDMGVEPFLISSSVTCVIAQRLLRMLCKNCRAIYTPDPEVLKEIGMPVIEHQIPIGMPKAAGGRFRQFYKRAGCDQCKQTGYQGRLGVFEVMIPDDDIRNLIVKKESAEVIKKAAVRKGMKTLKEDGLVKAQKGLTTIDEVLRVTQEF